jgi:ABC-2 type transport system permease protein
VGKFLAGWSFLGLSLLLTWPVVYQVGRLGNPDMGAIVTGYLACVLAAGAFLSIGMLFSALSKNQVVAFILGVAASTGFLLLGLPETLDYLGRVLGGYVEHVFLSLSLIDHFESLTRGLVELRSLAFFALFTAGWLAVGMLTLRETKGN